MDHFHGFEPSAEANAALAATSRKLDTATLFGASMDGPIDESVRERVKSHVIIEGQARTNSCGGHTGSTCLEFDNYLATGEWKQLSRWGMYIYGQLACGMSGDRGVRMDGLANAMRDTGAGDESLWKFTGSYHTAPQGGAAALAKYLDSAQGFRIQSWKVLKNYADMALWFQTGQGPVMMGIPWFTNWLNIPADGVLPQPNGDLHGFHAYPLLWLTKYMMGSRMYAEGPNSWTEAFGEKGWGYWSPSLLDYLFKYPGSVVIGVSGMAEDKAVARPLNRRRDSWFV